MVRDIPGRLKELYERWAGVVRRRPNVNTASFEAGLNAVFIVTGRVQSLCDSRDVKLVVNPHSTGNDLRRQILTS